MVRTFVVGVGMSKFQKPGTKEGDYPQWAHEAVAQALGDARTEYAEVARAYAGYCYGESTSGQRALYEVGITGIPIINVNNNCATGSTALYMARESVRSGSTPCALAVGFEKMELGSLQRKFPQHTDPIARHAEQVDDRFPNEGTPIAPAMFGNAAREHMARYGSTPEHFAWIGWKNHKHSVHNPYAQFQTEYTLEEVKGSRMIHEPLTLLQCSPTSDGAAAAILASEAFVDTHGLWDRAVEITAQAMATDLPSSFERSSSLIQVIGFDMTHRTVEMVYREAGISPTDVDVCELHDCFSPNELISYEALQFADVGKGHLLVDTEATTYGGSGPVVNPSGGLISKGHPLGATGLAQCAELTWQLRGEAAGRQVDGAKVALQHNLGIGGAVVVTAYQKVQPSAA